MEFKISVRNLVEFILRSGDIDNRSGVFSDNAMAEGGRIHRMIQKRMGVGYEAEVSLKYEYKTQLYSILLEGRADGIYTREDMPLMVDEIKGTYRDISKMKEPAVLHLAQAKCYAAILTIQRNLSEIAVRLTYCNMDTEELRYFEETIKKDEILDWFQTILTNYQKWTDLEYAWNELREESIQKLVFPFPYRSGQKDLASYVYQTIYHKKNIFLEAPTGVGKTISTLFPAIKAMGKKMAGKLFYLTAKTITGTVADETFGILREKGLSFKTVMLTAKEKICFMEETECNPIHCPYALGHYDRINDAIYHLLCEEERYSRQVIEEYARKYSVCPFEFCLDMSLFADGIICDYNYLFDPHVHLKRFFSEGNKGEYIFLIDEAHNLVDRGREMYSAVIYKEDFLLKKKQVKNLLPKMEHLLERCNKQMLLYKRECEGSTEMDSISSLILIMDRLKDEIEKYLEEETFMTDLRKEILSFYFEVCHFLEIFELMDEHYKIYAQLEDDGKFFIKLFCMDPRKNLRACLDKGRSSVLFSATLLPIQYYKNLLGGSKEDYEVYAHSAFDSRKKCLLLCSDVTSRYKRRGDSEYYRIAAYIHEIVRKRHGNYMIFFPSYAFLSVVFDCFVEKFFYPQEQECIKQETNMNDEERESFLQRFCSTDTSKESSLIGFCVLGGIFSEGIDLKNDSLIGVLIVGTGIPQICFERELLKEHYDKEGENGFDYAYRYPGMNKVFQAAGRVIRTTDDIGIIALLDERFLQGAYLRLFPREWDDYETITLDFIARRVEKFWDEWL